ncbi:MAG TPA: exopolysaccharide biosynthesis polyprenyl glycosylphosphotransferase [Acidocella sp.]|jgi:Undecaprenyl-phosphate glucose phosphotransferase|uniref:exopolysaccharide biosynthesis polyprenyl glycosylphosphotransferase n=1 Tax=Acidocella sp. TaxID=50710 RepID=UPI002B514E7F|nr:exopolysaccharide biosynthesis polyprenyl glycosylphosphotransferase [Acidocella sp.]HVE21417.1 exopolysaccharide biosynthesis polyprenyl glycosylphosphotransferase [Acidocella sp.]
MSGQIYRRKKPGLGMASATRASSYPQLSWLPASGGAASVAAPHDQRDHPLFLYAIRLIDGATVVLTSCAMAWAGSFFATRQQTVAISVADLVAVLVFFLMLPNPRLPILPFWEMSLQQLRFLMPPLILAGFVQAGVYWWLGWKDIALLRASCAWTISVTAGLIVTRGLSTFAKAHPVIETRLKRKIAVIGSDAHAFRTAERLSKESQNGISVLGVFDDGPRHPGQAQVQGTIASLISLSREIKLHGIIIALPPGAENETQIADLSWRLRGVFADVFAKPYMLHGPDVALPVQTIGAMPFLVLQRRPLDEWQRLIKKVLDVTVSLICVILLLLPLAVVAIAIKMDSPGPVLFRQPRLGFNNRQFMVFKFRSMYTNASDILSVKQTSRDDPRVTRVGKWLRKLSIDEMPQLLNVLRGEMSLVGPRPHALQTRVEGALLNDVTAEYIMRFHVKPGITGWAQVNGARGELVTTDDLRKRVAYDLEYIQNWSAWFDLKIMALTLVREIVSRNAF